jgi:hypothetical protein
MASSSSAPQPQVTTSSSGSSSSSTNTPFQQEYFAEGLGQARNLYNQGLPQYYQGQTVAGFTPAQMEAMNRSSNYMTGGQYDQMQGQTFDALSQGLSGNLDTRGFDNMSQMYQNNAMDTANDMMGQLRSNQVMSGQPGGSSRGDLLNNQVIQDANKQYSNNMAGLYNNAYQTAQANRMQSMGMANSLMANPMEMNKQLYNQVGLPQQQMNQATMNDAKQRYDYAAMAPWQNLNQYMNMMQGNMGGTTSSSSGGSSTTTAPGQPQGGGGSELGGLLGMAAGTFMPAIGPGLGSAAGGYLGGMLGL